MSLIKIRLPWWKGKQLAHTTFSSDVAVGGAKCSHFLKQLICQKAQCEVRLGVNEGILLKHFAESKNKV